MAAAGYDPLEMASMFKTIEKEGGSGGPQWLSDHPNPGDRYEYITREASAARGARPGTRYARVHAGAGATAPDDAGADHRRGDAEDGRSRLSASA